MSTLLLDDLADKGAAMTQALAAANPIQFLKRAGLHAGVIFSVCECERCEDRDGWTLFGVKDGEGRGGVSHGMCRGQLESLRVEMAARALRYAEKARN